MKNFLKNNAGFTLLEVTITAGLLGVVALGYLKFQQNQTKSTKTTINKVEINNYFQSVKSYLGKPGYCMHTLQELGSISDDLIVESIKRPDGVDKFKIGDSISGTNFKLTSMYVEDYYYEKKEDLTEFRGELTLVLELERQNDRSYGGKKQIKKIELDIIVDDQDKVVDCGALGGIYIPSGSSSVDSDTTTESTTETTQQKTEDLGKNEYDEAFENSIKDISKSTGKNLTQEDIQKAVSNSPEMQKAMESIKFIQQQNKKMEELFNE